MKQHTIGVDLSKDRFDAYRMADDAHRIFPNDRKGFQSFLAWIAMDWIAMEKHQETSPSPLLVVFEPTGPYHRAFEAALVQAGVGFVKVNPRQARRFAEATGKITKTDACDARMLARMGALLELEPGHTRSPAQALLHELHMARQALVKDRTAAKNREKNLTSPLLKRQNAQTLRMIEKQIAAIEEVLRQTIAAHEALARRFEIITSIPGISDITAFALLIEMPELGTLEAGQAASLAGLAPITRQSGRWSGHAFIRGGRANVRQALYMPAMVATRFNADLSQVYNRLRQAGKPAKVAITAIMRKLVILANTLIKNNRKWTQKIA